MVPFLGVLQLVPLLVLYGVTVSFALVSAVVWAALGGSGGSYPVALGGSVLLGAVALAGAEIAARARERRRDPAWVADLSTLARSRKVSASSIGGDAFWLAQAKRLGAPVPDTLVLTAELSERWISALRTAKSGADTWDLLPSGARGPLAAFLHRCQGGTLVVRPSFGENDPAHAYPAVLRSVEDVDPARAGAVLAAVAAVIESGHAPPAAAYRARAGLRGPLTRAVILQRVAEASVVGVARSRGLDGRTDTLLVDHARRRSAPSSFVFDLVESTARGLGPGAQPEALASWARRLLALLLALDHELGGAVRVEFVVEGERLLLSSVRRIRTDERLVWISRGGPLQAPFGRLARFPRDAYGGAAVLRGSASAALGWLTSVGAEEVRDDDGVRFLDVDVLRRALARLGIWLLLREPALALATLLRPMRRRSYPAPPDVGADLGRSFRRFKAWQTRSLQGMLREHGKLRLRRWIAEWALAMLADGATGAPVPLAHRALRVLLERRVVRLDAESARMLARVEESEREVRELVARMVATGAADYSGLFTGDRHLHAGMDEMERWADDPNARETLGARWDREKRAFSQREASPVAARLLEPPGAETLPSHAGSKLHVVGLVPGGARGEAFTPGDSRKQTPPGAVLVLADGRAELGPMLFDAGAVVLAGGGLLCPVAELARELGIPAVLCAPRRPLSMLPMGKLIAVDATHGAIAF